MTTMTAKPGDQLTWMRQSEALRCTVLATAHDGRYAQLRIEGWVSTQWEMLDPITFRHGHAWKIKNGNLIELVD